MSSGRKDSTDDDKLLTSEDLFGDMLDEKPVAAPKEPPGSAPAARRSGPIKVQVSEPLPKAPAVKSPLSGAPAEELPDDVAALLDAFSAPGEAAASAPPLEPAPDPEPAAPAPPPVMATDEEGLQDLRGLRGELKPVVPAEAPVTKSRTGTKFRAGNPQVIAPQGKTLDLAAIA